VPPNSARRIVPAHEGFADTRGFIDAHCHMGLVSRPHHRRRGCPIQKATGAVSREWQRRRTIGADDGLLPVPVRAERGRMSAHQPVARMRHRVSRDLTASNSRLAGKDPATESHGAQTDAGGQQGVQEKWKKYEKDLEEWKKTGQTKIPSRRRRNRTETPKA